MCIIVKAGIHYSKYGRAWQLPDNIWQQNQSCQSFILFAFDLISRRKFREDIQIFWNKNG